MKSVASLSMDIDLLKKAKEAADIHVIPLSQLVSLALVEFLQRYDAFDPEERARVLGSIATGRRALSTEEFARRTIEREQAVRALRKKNKVLPKGKTLEEIEKDEREREEAKKQHRSLLAGVDDDPELAELERQAFIEHGMAPPTGKKDDE